MFWRGSNGSLTPRIAAVSGISCMSPCAPVCDTARGSKPDSAWMTARMRRAGTAYRADASAISREYLLLSRVARLDVWAMAGVAIAMAAVTARRTRDRGLKRSMPVLQGNSDTDTEFPQISLGSATPVRDEPGGSLTGRGQSLASPPASRSAAMPPASAAMTVSSSATAVGPTPGTIGRNAGVRPIENPQTANRLAAYTSVATTGRRRGSSATSSSTGTNARTCPRIPPGAPPPGLVPFFSATRLPTRSGPRTKSSASPYYTGMAEPPTRPHVVIVGGGFGGLYAARALAGRPVRVTLLDRRNHHPFQPLLYQVATAALNPSDIAVPLRSILRRATNVTVFLASVERVDLAGRRVVLDRSEIGYDALILAAGASHSYFGHDDWELLAPGLKTLEDALEIRRRVLLAYAAAERERA